MNKLFYLLFFTLSLVSCSSNKHYRADSIKNIKNYSSLPFGQLSRAYLNDDLVLLSREMRDVDLVPYIYHRVYPNGSSDLYISFNIFTYSDQIKVFPNVRGECFAEVDWFGRNFSYHVLDYPEAIIIRDIKHDDNYGDYAWTSMKLADGGRLDNVLITPMAYRFIMSHDYKDSRNLVFVLIENENKSEDHLWWPNDKDKKKYDRTGVICLADVQTALLIQMSYSSILTRKY